MKPLSIWVTGHRPILNVLINKLCFRLKNGLVKGKWYLVEIGQYFSEGEYIYYIKINDQIVKQMVNNQPTEFNNFVAYASNPWTRN